MCATHIIFFIGCFLKMASFKKIIYLFLCIIYGCAGSSLLLVGGLSLIAESRGYSVVAMCGLLSWSTGSRYVGSVAVVHGLSCSTICGVFPDQGSKLCPLHWQTGFFFFFQQSSHQGSPQNGKLLNVRMFRVSPACVT